MNRKGTEKDVPETGLPKPLIEVMGLPEASSVDRQEFQLALVMTVISLGLKPVDVRGIQGEDDIIILFPPPYRPFGASEGNIVIRITFAEQAHVPMLIPVINAVKEQYRGFHVQGVIMFPEGLMYR